MNLYFAPLEGITTYTYRNTHAEFFGGCDKYFAPFITPSDNEKLSLKCLRDILPEKNSNIKLVPQVLTNRSDSFLKFEEKLSGLGYDCVNINLGCPSGTVVKKNRGSGFLRDPQGIDCFLAEIFQQTRLFVSIKTRTGFSDRNEFDELLRIFNKHSFENLTVHPRTRMDYYNGEPDMTAFDKAYSHSKNKLCYNGNVFSKTDFEKIAQNYPTLDGIMIGRGAVANPALFREIRGGRPLETKELEEFTRVLAERYLQVLGSEVYTLHKLKEIWIYIMWNFPEEKKITKAIKKSNKLLDLLDAVHQLAVLRKNIN